MSRQVDPDYAATTFTAPEVVTAMTPFFTESFGNPSSIYSFSERNRKAIAKARQQVADVIGASADEIFFTSGGTEADNWALKGAAWRGSSKANHIITTKIEHHAVLHTAQFLQENGFDVTFLDVDAEGRVSLDDIRKAVTEKTILVSVMFANNEIGTMQPVAEIGAFCREKGILFHTDAVQAVAHVPIDVKAMNIDMLSLSAHKFYGPKGVGMAYVNRKIKVKPMIIGGGQEDGLRSGSYNLPGIIGLATALELAYKERTAYLKKITALRDYFWKKIQKEIPEVRLNGSLKKRVPANLNIMFGYIEGEAILMDLTFKGIYVSTGSACSASDLRASYVLKAMGLNKNFLNSNIRFSFGRFNTKAEVDYTIKALKGTVKRLRSFSPIN